MIPFRELMIFVTIYLFSSFSLLLLKKSIGSHERDLGFKLLFNFILSPISFFFNKRSNLRAKLYASSLGLITLILAVGINVYIAQEHPLNADITLTTTNVKEINFAEIFEEILKSNDINGDYYILDYYITFDECYEIIDLEITVGESKNFGNIKYEGIYKDGVISFTVTVSEDINTNIYTYNDINNITRTLDPLNYIIQNSIKQTPSPTRITSSNSFSNQHRLDRGILVNKELTKEAELIWNESEPKSILEITVFTLNNKQTIHYYFEE